MSVLTTMQLFAAESAGHGSEHAAEEAAGIAALGIDPIAIAAQAATFLLLFFIIKKFAMQNIVDTLEKRRQTIDDGVRLGLEMEKAKAELETEVDKLMHKARDEADKIIAEGRTEASGIIKEAEEAASRKAEGILADAHARIDEDIKQARKGLEQEMRGLVAEATERIIGEKLDANKDASLIDRALSGVAGVRR